MKSKENEFAKMKTIIEEMKSSKAGLTHDVNSEGIRKEIYLSQLL